MSVCGMSWWDSFVLFISIVGVLYCLLNRRTIDK